MQKSPQVTIYSKQAVILLKNEWTSFEDIIFSILIVYKYEISKKNFDKYSESFDLVVNSFTVDVE